MAPEYPPRSPNEEASAYFSVIEPLSRLRGLLPTTFPQPESADGHDIPTTSSRRRRASIIAPSLDQDEHLSEMVTEQQEWGTAVAETAAKEETVLYLAYGSNLAAKTFRGMRKIKPLSQVRVLVPELRLTFDLRGVPYAEPCFAGTHYRDPDAENDLNDEPEDDVSVISEGELLSEKAPLISETQEVHELDYHKHRWHKPLVGVVYEVTLADYAKIIATEGGGRGYRDVVVDCHTFADGYNSSDPVPNHPVTPAFKAHTLLSPAADDTRRRAHAMKSGQPTAPQPSTAMTSWFGLRSPQMRPDPEYAQPSARYLNLLVTGAAEHDLPISYQQYLAQIRTYRTTTIRQKIGKLIFLAVWGPIVLSTIALARAFAGPDGRSPPLLATLVNCVFEVMWNSYDAFFVKVFGDGERTLEDIPPM